jgi:hypothetical protein
VTNEQGHLCGDGCPDWHLRCDLCWLDFDTPEALAAHVEMEEFLTYPLGQGW